MSAERSKATLLIAPERAFTCSECGTRIEPGVEFLNDGPSRDIFCYPKCPPVFEATVIDGGRPDAASAPVQGELPFGGLRLVKDEP